MNPALQAEGSLVTVSDGRSPFGPGTLRLEEGTCGSSSATALQRQGSSDPIDTVTLVAARRSYVPVPLLFHWPRERVDLDPLYLEWLSLIKGCQLGRMLSQYNDLLLLHKCQVKAGTSFQSRRHLSCDSVVLKWLTPAAPNGGCKLSGAGAVDWKVPTVQSVFLQHGKGAGTQRGGSCALSVGCFVSKSENTFCNSHPPPTVAVPNQVLLCELLPRLGPFNLIEKRLRKEVSLA